LIVCPNPGSGYYETFKIKNDSLIRTLSYYRY
jgi:hypothetical protein